MAEGIERSDLPLDVEPGTSITIEGIDLIYGLTPVFVAYHLLESGYNAGLFFIGPNKLIGEMSEERLENLLTRTSQFYRGAILFTENIEGDYYHAVYLDAEEQKVYNPSGFITPACAYNFTEVCLAVLIYIDP
jgi:hypothetical protein